MRRAKAGQMKGGFSPGSGGCDQIPRSPGVRKTLDHRVLSMASSMRMLRSGRSRVFKTLLAAPLALSVLWAAAAHAQPPQTNAKLETARFEWGVQPIRYGEGQEDRRFSTDALRRLQERIDWAYSRGALSAREANRLQDRAEALRDRARSYWRSRGVDWQERRDLDDRFNELRQEMRYLVWDREYRGEYRNEWRDSRLWSEEGWRGDDEKSGRDGAQAGRPDEDAFEPGDDADERYPRKPYSSSKAPEPKAGQDQPFKDGRDFH